MSDDKPIVWILGAGFSMPLGGPPFADLISPQVLDNLRGWGDYNEHGQSGGFLPINWAEAVLGVYSLGLEPQHRWWKDAEQFLDRLDFLNSHSGGSLANRVRNAAQVAANTSRFHNAGGRQHVPSTAAPILANLKFDRLRLEAIRFVAGATSQFLVSAEPNQDENLEFIRTSELWEPYIRWARLLQRGDTVINFNYDRSVHLIALASKMLDPMSPTPPPDPLKLFKPIDATTGKPPADGRWVAECPLHGHANWELGPNGEPIWRDYIVALKEPEKALIATPGVAKKAHANEALGHLWKYAMGQLELAGAVVLVGYRFPPTDNHAKMRLFEALENNPEVPVQIVLGPNNKDMARAQQMVVMTRKHPALAVPQPMYAEDFFAVFSRQKLLDMRNHS